MARFDLPKTYDYRSVEQRLYAWWEEQGYFKPGPDGPAAPFVISIPPPNVTGELHLGHAMFVAHGRPDDPLPPHEGRCRRCGCPAPTTPASPRSCRWRRLLRRGGH